MKTSNLVTLSLFNVAALTGFMAYIHHQGKPVNGQITQASDPEEMSTDETAEDSYPIDIESLSGLSRDFNVCLAQLDTLDIDYEVIGDQRRSYCSLTQQVSLRSGQIDYAVPFQATCTMVAAIALWEEQVVQESAREYLGEEIARIHHYGSFSCRTMRGRPSLMSTHASGNALDVSAFETVSGRMVHVYGNWDRQDNTGQFLHAIRDRSCGIFPAVLGPDYDYNHRNHFHLEYSNRNHRVCD